MGVLINGVEGEDWAREDDKRVEERTHHGLQGLARNAVSIVEKLLYAVSLGIKQLLRLSLTTINWK